MYETIYKALQEAGLENVYEPQDYLNFFCLGNRELPDDENILNAVNPTGQNTPQVFVFTLLGKLKMFFFFLLRMFMPPDQVSLSLVFAHWEPRYSLKRTEDL